VTEPTDRCPCLSGETYGECCGPFHAGTATAPTAERLMRSRYSAYVLGNEPYLLSTWHSRTRPKSMDLDDEIRWIGLDILGRTRGGMLDTDGTVEYRAHFSVKGRRGDQHENGRFVRENKRWLYLDASAPVTSA